MSTSLPNIIKIIPEYELLPSERITQTKQRTTKFPRHLTNRKSLLKYHGSGIKPTSLSLYINNSLMQLSPIPRVPSRASKFPLHLASPNDSPLSHCYGKPDQDRKKISRRKLSKAELPPKKKMFFFFLYYTISSILISSTELYKQSKKKQKQNNPPTILDQHEQQQSNTLIALILNCSNTLILFNLLGRCRLLVPSFWKDP